MPLPGHRLSVGSLERIDDSPAGQAFLSATSVEVLQDDGVRVYLPLLDGSDQVGAMVVTLNEIDDDDRRLLRRLAGLVADMIVTKDAYTDQFFEVRRRARMSVAAEIQWSLLPPLSMTVPQAEVAGILEPAYDVAGDSFDYALNDDILYVCMIDAMGHGLDAATMATVAIGAYRHARRAAIELSEMYAFMDQAIDDQFGPDHFVTAQMIRLDITTGHLQWVNAGHPDPVLIRNRAVAGRLESATTLPVGFGGAAPRISERKLEPGDMVLCFTDGLTEEHGANGEQFGEEQLIESANRALREHDGLRAIIRSLSHTLKRERGGVTTDDATLFLIEWRGGSAEHLALFEDELAQSAKGDKEAT